MPIRYEVRNDGKLVHSVAAGPVGEADLLDYQTALLSDPRIKPGFNELFDATLAREAGLTEAVLTTMIEADLSHADKLRGGKCAIVIWDGFEWAERFVHAHKGPNEVMVFINMDVARTWIGASDGVQFAEIGSGLRWARAEGSSYQ